MTAYGYWSWKIIKPLLLTAGVSYDYLHYPENFRVPPLSDAEERTVQVSPKAGFILTLFRGATIRGAYTRSLGGVSFDQSFRLEPTQIGGFNQAYRNVMPESVVGSLSAVHFETWSLGVDRKMTGRTYLGAQFECLNSAADQSVGTRDKVYVGVLPNPLLDQTSTTRQSFDYEERNIRLSFDQLLGGCFALGARYRWSNAQLSSWFPAVPLLGRADVEATLHQVQLHMLAYDRTGFFGGVEALWNQQSNRGYTPDLPGDDFWQFNLHAGYRFPRRHAEIRLSLLNVTDQDYRLNPLNLTRELPRERTIAVSCRFYF